MIEKIQNIFGKNINDLNSLGKKENVYIMEISMKIDYYKIKLTQR
jgi:hypothetical protein